jgi:hypothetical protein
MKANDYNTLQSHLSDGTFPIIIATLSVGKKIKLKNAISPLIKLYLVINFSLS